MLARRVRTAPIPAPFPPSIPLILLAAALGLCALLAGCGTEKKPTSANPRVAPTAPPATPTGPSVTGLQLTDDYGRITRITTTRPARGLYLYAADSTRFAATLLGPNGPVGPGTGGRLFAITPVFSDSGLAGGSISTGSSGDSLLLLGRSAGADSLRFRVALGDTVLYASPPVPLSFSQLPAVNIDHLFVDPPVDPLSYQTEFGVSGVPIVYTRGQVRDSLNAEFSVPSRFIEASDSSLGHTARLVFLTDVPGVLHAAAVRGRPLRFRLEAVGNGSVQLAIRLVRGSSVLYQSPTVAFQVIEPGAGWWPGFDQDNAPQGSVSHLAVWQNALIVSGSFSQVGSLAASGLARWDGGHWSSLSWSHGPSPLILTDGNALVAGTPSGGFYEWDGSAWNSFAPAYPGATGAALYHGELVVAHGNLYVWRGGAWVLLASPAWSRTSTGGLAVFQDHLYVAAVSTVNMFGQEIAWIGQVNGSQFSQIFEEDGGEEGETTPEIDYLKGSDDGVFFSWDDSGQGFTSGVRELSSQGSIGAAAGGWDTYILAHAVGGLNGVLYAGADVRNGKAVLVGESGILTKLADVTGGGVVDMAAFQGSLYVGGWFTAVGGVPAFGIARYTPAQESR